MICPNCGKKLPERQAIFELVSRDGVCQRVRTGWREPYHKYKPFCTLRCGFDFGRAAWKKLLQRK